MAATSKSPNQLGSSPSAPSAPAAPVAPAAPLSVRLKESIVGFMRLESMPLTFAFWAAIFLSALAFLLCPYPPMIDYPQHVALGAVLRELADPSSPSHELYETNLFTYNGGIELSVAALAFVMSPELAGRVVLAAHVLVFAAAALCLCDYSRRPRWYALLASPLLYNHITGWGFSNFVIALPLAVLVTVMWMRIVDGSRAKWHLIPTLALSMVVAYTHVLVMLCICVVVFVVTVEALLHRGSASVVERIRKLIVPAIVLVPAVGYSVGAWYWARATSTTVWEHSWAEGQDDPLWSKLRHVLYHTTGNFADGSDQFLAAAAICLGVVLWFSAREGKGTDPRMRRLALVFLGLYAVVPKVFVATFHIYQRFLPLALLFGIAAIPAVRGRHVRWVAHAAAVLAMVISINTLLRFLTIPEVDDALGIIDDAPPNGRLLMVTYDPTPPSYSREIWVHLPALYQVRHDGLVAYTFLRNESPPVRYRYGKEPPRAPGGFEWNGELYDVYADYARTYDLVLVRSWLRADGGVADPAQHVFKGMADQTKLLARRGRFFLYDLSKINAVLIGEKPPEADR